MDEPVGSIESTRSGRYRPLPGKASRFNGTATALGVTTVALMFSTDYTILASSEDAGLQGRIDAAIVVELVVYALAGVLVALLWRPRARWNGATRLLLTFAILGVSLSPLSVLPAFSLVKAAQLVILVLFAHVLGSIRDDGYYQVTYVVFIGLTTISIVSGVIWPTPLDARFAWFSMQPNIVGGYLAVAVMLLFAALLHRDRGMDRSAVWTAGLLVVHVAALAATISRTAIAGALCGSAVIWYLWAGTRRAGRLLVIGLLAALAALVFGDEIAFFLIRGDDTELLTTLSGRTNLFAEAWELFRRQPLVGYGFLSSRTLFLDTIGLSGAHNLIVNLFISTGVVGAALYFAGVVLLVRTLMSVQRFVPARSRDALTAATFWGILTFLLVQGSTEGRAAGDPSLETIWLLLTLGWSTSKVGVHRKAAEVGPGAIGGSVTGANART